MARYIGTMVFRSGGVSIGKLVRKSDGLEDVNQVIKTLMKYGKDFNDCSYQPKPM